MNAITWDDSYTVGVGDLDNQHKGLLNIINRLIEANNKKADSKQCSDIIALLIHYAYTHFAAEENYMTQVEYPDQQKHILEHVDFIMKVMSLSLKVEQGSQSDRSELLDFLKEWFASHVLGTDRYYIPYFAAKGF